MDARRTRRPAAGNTNYPSRLRRGLFQFDRHADGAASANANDPGLRWRHPADQVRFSNAHSHSDQARLQEPQARDWTDRAQQLHRRLLGGSGLQLVQRPLISLGGPLDVVAPLSLVDGAWRRPQGIATGIAQPNV